MNNIKDRIKIWKNPDFQSKLIFNFSLFTFVLIINYYAVRYATKNAGFPIDDLLLSNIKRVDTSFIHADMSGIIKLYTILLLINYPNYIHFVLKSVGLLILIRCFFINLTFLGTPYYSIPVKSYFTYGGDLFFSGHVALPFLIALIFWKIKFIRYTYISISFLMGAEVLLGHYHYSIDVFVAPFITYSVFILSKKIFVKDYAFLKRIKL